MNHSKAFQNPAAARIVRLRVPRDKSVGRECPFTRPDRRRRAYRRRGYPYRSSWPRRARQQHRCEWQRQQRWMPSEKRPKQRLTRRMWPRFLQSWPWTNPTRQHRQPKTRPTPKPNPWRTSQRRPGPARHCANRKSQTGTRLFQQGRWGERWCSQHAIPHR